MCVLFAVCSAALLCPLLRAVRCGAALLCCALYYVLCAVLCVCVLCAPRPRQPQNHPKAKEQQANHKDISQQRQATPKDIHRKKKSSGAEDTNSGGQRKPCPRPSELEQMCAVCRPVLLCYALYYVLRAVLLRCAAALCCCAVLLRCAVCPRLRPPRNAVLCPILCAVRCAAALVCVPQAQPPPKA